MRKNLFLMLTLIVLSAASANAQVKIGGTSTDDPDPGAVLDLTNPDNLGLLLPQVSTLPASGALCQLGMMVYNTAAQRVYTHNGGTG
ncbi:MAG: hypothetical protein LBO74_11905, partial [Candidatus Symbiothrix sp.]|nr:hypothetical protein [Candidatus Symbiothrix sp.]